MDYDDWRSAHGVAEPSEGIKTMKLGDKLKQTLDELDRARIQGLEAQAAADMEKIRRERELLAEWLENIRLDFVDAINAGKVPLKKIKAYDRQAWLKKAISGKAEHQDIWTLFTKFWAGEGLDVAVLEGHDGVGQESWINLTLKIMPTRPRTVNTGQHSVVPSSETHGLKFDLDVGEYRG